MAGPRDLESVRWTRERLLGLGFADEHLAFLETGLPSRLGLAHLDPSTPVPELTALVGRLDRWIRPGRGLSIYVTGRRADAQARQHAGLQLALALAGRGRQVVLADAEFLRPGLGGLLPESEAEGIIDMVRFGRSCRSVLVRPVPGGPHLLPAGSFPADEPVPFGTEGLRSLLFRVSQVCEIALYVGPLPVRSDLNPLARECDHVLYTAQEDPSASQDLLDAIAELQKEGAHVAGVVVYLAEGAARPKPVPWDAEFKPGFLYPESSPGLGHKVEPPQRAAQAPIAPPSIEPAPFAPPQQPPPPPPPSGPMGVAANPNPTAPPEEDDVARVVPRTGEEARQVREELDLPDTELVFEEGRYSRWPLVLLVTLLVLITGFVSWALWARRGIEGLAGGRVATSDTPSRVLPPPTSTPPEEPGALRRPDDQAASQTGATASDPGTAPDDGAAHRAQSVPPASGGSAEGGRTRPESPVPPSRPDTTSEPSGAVRYAVHVASFKTKKQAEDHMVSLRGHGFEARALEVDLGSKGIWYRVFVGSYPTAAQAAQARVALLELPAYTYAQVRRLPRE